MQRGCSTEPLQVSWELILMAAKATAWLEAMQRGCSTEPLQKYDLSSIHELLLAIHARLRSLPFPHLVGMEALPLPQAYLSLPDTSPCLRTMWTCSRSRRGLLQTCAPWQSRACRCGLPACLPGCCLCSKTDDWQGSLPVNLCFL